jgi:hypothetical protein
MDSNNGIHEGIILNSSLRLVAGQARRFMTDPQSLLDRVGAIRMFDITNGEC